MKNFLILILSFICLKSFSQQQTVAAKKVNATQTLTLQDWYVTHFERDTDFQNQINQIPTSAAVYDFVLGRLAHVTGGGGPSITPNLQAVLDAGSNLTKFTNIDVSGNVYRITNSSNIELQSQFGSFQTIMNVAQQAYNFQLTGPQYGSYLSGTPSSVMLRLANLAGNSNNVTVDNTGVSINSHSALGGKINFAAVNYNFSGIATTGQTNVATYIDSIGNLKQGTIKIDWSNITNVPGSISAITTSTSSTISGLISGNQNKASATIIAGPLTFDYSTSTLGIKIANPFQDGAIAKEDFANFQTAFLWGNHKNFGYLTRDSLAVDSTYLPAPLYFIEGLNGAMDTLAVAYSTDSTDGVITALEHLHNGVSYNKWVVRGIYSAGTTTYTRNDSTTFNVTGYPTNNNQLSNGSNFISGILALNSGTAVNTTQRPGLNFIGGTNMSITATDDPTNNRVNLTFNASGGSSGSAALNQDLIGVGNSSNFLGGYNDFKFLEASQKLIVGTIGSLTQTATPASISLGSTISNGAGGNLKLKLYEDATTAYGFGVALGSLDAVISDNFSDFKWYANGGTIMTLKNGGNLFLGNPTSVSTSTPLTLDLGATYSSVAGSNLKVKLYNNNTQAYGFGVSSNEFDIVITDATSSFKWFTNGTAKMTLSNAGVLSLGANTVLTSASSIPYTQIPNLQSDLNLKAPIASPSFSGTPLAPTAAPGTNNTQIATTAYVLANTGEVNTYSNLTPGVNTTNYGGFATTKSGVNFPFRVFSAPVNGGIKVTAFSNEVEAKDNMWTWKNSFTLTTTTNALNDNIKVIPFPSSDCSVQVVVRTNQIASTGGSAGSAVTTYHFKKVSGTITLLGTDNTGPGLISGTSIGTGVDGAGNITIQATGINSVNISWNFGVESINSVVLF
jgi:hypothetical protein